MGNRRHAVRGVVPDGLHHAAHSQHRPQPRLRAAGLRRLRRMRTFGLLHATYSALTVVNVVLGVLVTLWIQKEHPSQDS